MNSTPSTPCVLLAITKCCISGLGVPVMKGVELALIPCAEITPTIGDMFRAANRILSVDDAGSKPTADPEERLLLKWYEEDVRKHLVGAFVEDQGTLDKPTGVSQITDHWTLHLALVSSARRVY